MNLRIYARVIALSCMFSFISTTSFAEQQIDFSDENFAKETLLNVTWNCTVSDEYYTGPTTWKFEEIKGKKVRGYTLWCNEKAVVKGKLKKNILKYTLITPGKGNCNTSGSFEFSIDEDDFVLAKGSYRYTGADVSGKKGTISECNSYPDE